MGHLLLCMHGRLRKHYFHFLVDWLPAGKAPWPLSSHMTISGSSRTLLLEGSKVAGGVWLRVCISTLHLGESGGMHPLNRF